MLWGRDCSYVALRPQAFKGSIVHPPELMNKGLWWNAVANRRVQRMACPGANLSNANLTRIVLGGKPNHHDDNPARTGLRRAPSPPGRLIIWRPFEPIFLKLQEGWRIFLRARAQIWDNCRRNSFGRENPEFTCTLFPITPMVLAPLVGWSPGKLPGWRLSEL
jgi:hypothetical protein